jgi:hypothetical protein
MSVHGRVAGVAEAAGDDVNAGDDGDDELIRAGGEEVIAKWAVGIGGNWVVAAKTAFGRRPLALGNHDCHRWTPFRQDHLPPTAELTGPALPGPEVMLELSSRSLHAPLPPNSSSSSAACPSVLRPRLFVQSLVR